jgi:TPP-dependent pyruvate/acetoin dehydrogenase alpha subunit
MNLAGVAHLPVVFICENNGYAISVPSVEQMAAPVAVRAAGYGMPGVTLDGTDVDAVHHAATAAIETARAGGGPSILELLVPRLVPHSSQDDEGYRTDAQRTEAASSDPLPRIERRVVEAGLLDEEAVRAERRAAHDRVLEDARRALDEPDPDPGRARLWLYAESGPAGS